MIQRVRARWWAISPLVVGCGGPTGPISPGSAPEQDPIPCTAPLVWHRDADGDGLGDPDARRPSCAPPPGWVSDGSDCDDGDPAAGAPRAWHVDEDGDGYGAIEPVYACDAPANAVDDATDCDDAHAEAHPGGVERCADGLDGDCDGSPTPCRYDGDVSLARALRFTGEHEYGEAGRPVVGIGDVNFDGYDDLAIGAGFAPGTLDEAGEVYLITGPLTTGHALSQSWSIFMGDLDGRHVGLHGRMGDTDGDGRADVLLFRTGRGYNPGDHAIVSGHGPGRAEFGDLPSIGLPYLARYVGLGDLDQDGFDDLIGTDVEDWTGGHQSGAAYVFTGPLTGELTLEDAAYTFYGAPGMLVYQPADVGDLDGDGRPDVALGGASSFVDFVSGSVYVVTEPVPGAQFLADADAILHGTEREEQAGNDLDGAGDVNGDGYGDLIIGSTTYQTEDRSYTQRVAATLVLGPVSGEHRLPDVGARFWCDDHKNCAGSDVAGVGDLDGDGFDDYAIGAAIAENPDGDDVGVVFLFYGPDAASAEIYDAPARLYGESFSLAGDSIDAAGDVDGDGFADLVIGAWYFYGDDLSHPQPRIGAAYVVLGGAL